MAIMNQIKELEDGTVTVPIFDASVVDDLFRPRLATVDKIGFEVSYRRELGHESGSDYHITIFIGDRRIETTDPNDVVFGTWYPRGGKGWAEALAFRNDPQDSRCPRLPADREAGHPRVQRAHEGVQDRLPLRFARWIDVI